MSAPLGIKAGCGLLPLAHTSTSLRPAPALPALRRRAGGAAFNATAADQLAEALEAAVLPALEGLVSASVGVLVDAGVVAGEARRGWEAHRHKEPPHPRSPLISGADEAQAARFVEVVQAVVAAGRPDSMPPQDARRPPPGPERPAAGSHGRALLQGGTPQPPAGLAPLTELASTIDTEDLSSPLPFYAALLQPALAWVLPAASQGNAAAAAARQQLLAELAAALAPLVEQVHRCTETGRHPTCLPACGGSPCRPHRPASLPSAAHRCSMPPPTRSMLWWREWRMCMCRRPPPKQAGRRGAAGVCGRGEGGRVHRVRTPSRRPAIAPHQVPIRPAPGPAHGHPPADVATLLSDPAVGAALNDTAGALARCAGSSVGAHAAALPAAPHRHTRARCPACALAALWRLRRPRRASARMRCCRGRCRPAPSSRSPTSWVGLDVPAVRAVLCMLGHAAACCPSALPPPPLQARLCPGLSQALCRVYWTPCLEWWPLTPRRHPPPRRPRPAAAA